MNADVIIVGAGIIGCALAEQLAGQGMKVCVLDRAGIGQQTSASGMGHLVALGDHPAVLALALRSLKLWRERQCKLPDNVEYVSCGTLWLASNATDVLQAQENAELFTAAGVRNEWLDAAALRRTEATLVTDLSGGLRVPDDAVIYPPNAVLHFAENAMACGARFEIGVEAVSVAGGEVRLADGGRRRAPYIVVAAGCATSRLLPELKLLPRKGHLLITTAQVPRIHHQLIELGYHQSAQGQDPVSVAFNVQPRRTGQLLIGSSRQFDDESADLVPAVLSRMLQRGQRFLPELPRWPALRAWTGLRPCTPDNTPYIGNLARDRSLWVAAGHEGLGITTATGTAELLAQQICGNTPLLDGAAMSPNRSLAA